MDRCRVSAVVASAVLSAALVFTALAAAVETTPGAILKSPVQFDGAQVTLRGTVTGLRATVSRRGNPYYTFTLSAGDGGIAVFSFGEPTCPEGARVTVDGRFDRVKQVSGRTFHNEVEAAKVACR